MLYGICWWHNISHTPGRGLTTIKVVQEGMEWAKDVMLGDICMLIFQLDHKEIKDISVKNYRQDECGGSCEPRKLLGLLLSIQYLLFVLILLDKGAVSQLRPEKLQQLLETSKMLSPLYLSFKGKWNFISGGIVFCDIIYTVGILGISKHSLFYINMYCFCLTQEKTYQLVCINYRNRFCSILFSICIKIA